MNGIMHFMPLTTIERHHILFTKVPIVCSIDDEEQTQIGLLDTEKAADAL